tara:strand:+ start:1730 stop:2101 length:372 start_codon:yes stop_codon:yes gene_type:complete
MNFESIFLLILLFIIVIKLKYGKRDYVEKITYIDDNGYLRYTDSNKLVHRHIAERDILKRKLRRGEVVHHRNRNKRDNRKYNLQVFRNQAEHDAQHRHDAKKHGKHSYTGYTKNKIRFDKKSD